MAQISENEIREIVSKVINNISGAATAAAPKNYDSTQYGGRKFIGIYSDMNAAIEAANEGYKAVRAMQVEEREKIITEIRKLCREEAPVMASLGVAETKMGKVEHKRLKHILVADKTPGTEDIVSAAGEYKVVIDFSTNANYSLQFTQTGVVNEYGISGDYNQWGADGKDKKFAVDTEILLINTNC